jgi:hypothetical protein
MRALSTLRASALLAGLAAAGAGFAAQAIEVSRTIPSDVYYVTPSADYYYVTTGYAPTTTTVDYYYVVPAATIYAEPAITVYGERRTEDQLITEDVADAIGNDPRISGYVGVETRRNDVTLTGLVTTPGQADRAGRDARSVDGVRDVHNHIRAKVGG